MRQAVAPWVLPYDPDDPEEIKKSVGAHLTVLPNADARSIEEACSTGKYTHVHILAHGVPYTKREDRRYGIALHDSRDPNCMDVVEGDRLATLLRAQEDRGKCRLSRPDVVTLASCESGQVGSVVGAGASVAHALHEAGIPLVVASQFPLSFDGSVLMIKLLYEGLLSGEDPRCLIDNLRRQLRVRVPKTHDWASVVAYASFPENLEEELSQLRIIQAKRALSAALKHAGEAVEEMSARTAKFAIKRGRRWDRSKDAPTAALALPREKVDKAKARMADLFKIEKAPENRVSLLGQLASAEKQEAEILARAAHHDLFAHYYEVELEDTKATDLTNARTGLERSRRYYEEAFEVDPSQSWCLVQALVLSYVLNPQAGIDDDRWNLASLLAGREANHELRYRRAWAQGSLMELYLLKWLGSEIIERRDVAAKATEHARRFVDLAPKGSFELFSTWRQVLRYFEIFNLIAEWDDVSLAVEILEILPEPDPQ